MILDQPRKLVQLLLKRRYLAILVACSTVVLPPGLRGRLFPARTTTAPSSVVSSSTLDVPLPPAELVQLDAGTRMPAGGAPKGWSHLVLETVPRLATGDLDTVSAQAHETARKVRPLILADVRRTESAGVVRYHLARVGVGLCAPGADDETRVVVSSTSVDGSRGPWTTKQRLILAAMALETSRASLPLRTPTFAILRTPVTFLVGGSHQKINTCYAFRVDPADGSLATVVWQELPSGGDTLPARRPSVNVFDSPMDVKASRLLGSLPVSWSFAVRELPPGSDLNVPRPLRDQVSQAGDDSANGAAIEQSFARLLGSSP